MCIRDSCEGIVDVFEEAGLKIFGPAKNAARLEASKVFCKQVLRASDVPTADFSEFSSAEAAERFINERYEESPDDCPVVVKADGLAAVKERSFVRLVMKLWKRST